MNVRIKAALTTFAVVGIPLASFAIDPVAAIILWFVLTALGVLGVICYLAYQELLGFFERRDAKARAARIRRM